MAVSKRLRYEILTRDGHRCRYCGATAPDVKLVIDHVTPTALGGRDEPSNLVTACEPCNSGKTSTVPGAAVVENVAEDALRWAAAIKQAAAELEAQDEPKRRYQAGFKKAWNAWTWEDKGKKRTFDLDQNWRTSLERFRQAGLPASVWPDIIEKAMTHKTVLPSNLFRYCCGVGWNMVTELQERAKTLVSPASTVETAKEDRDDPVADAAVHVWVQDWTGQLPDEKGRAFEASVVQAQEDEVADSHRLLEAARHGAWHGLTDINEALDRLDRSEAWEAWSLAWQARCGDFPDDRSSDMFQEQVDKLRSSGVLQSRILRAAVYAGATRSARLYFGLGDRELEATGETPWLLQAVEEWAHAYQASAQRWPSGEERIAFTDSVFASVEGGNVLLTDLLAAATSTGLYQGTQVGPSLTRLGSAFEAAAALSPLPN